MKSKDTEVSVHARAKSLAGSKNVKVCHMFPRLCSHTQKNYDTCQFYLLPIHANSIQKSEKLLSC